MVHSSFDKEVHIKFSKSFIKVLGAITFTNNQKIEEKAAGLIRFDSSGELFTGSCSCQRRTWY